VRSLRRRNSLPPRHLASDVSFLLDVSLTLNQSLEVLSVGQNPNGVRDPEMNPVKYLETESMATRHTFELLSSTLRGAVQLVEIGNVYLVLWSDLGTMHAGVVLRRILAIHPSLAWVVRVILSSLLSLHTATLLYACLLYIREAIVMATEMDPELTIA